MFAAETLAAVGQLKAADDYKRPDETKLVTERIFLRRKRKFQKYVETPMHRAVFQVNDVWVNEAGQIEDKAVLLQHYSRVAVRRCRRYLRKFDLGVLMAIHTFRCREFSHLESALISLGHRYQREAIREALANLRDLGFTLPFSN